MVMASLAIIFVVPPLMKGRERPQKVTVAIALLVPLLAIGMYALLGKPSATDNISGRSTVSQNAGVGPVTQQSDTKAGSVASLVDGLEERLKEESGDAKGWLLLARSYQHLNRLEEAAQAYARASALGMSDVKLASSLATSNESISGKAEIRGRVSLAATAAGQVAATDTVFVFAKAVDGSPMPVAALRKRAGQLPLEFVLNDELSLVDVAKLSSFEHVVVSARISRSGNAMREDTDLTAQSEPIMVINGDFVELEIEAARILDDSY